MRKVNQLIENFNIVSLQTHAKLNHDQKKSVDRMESVSKSKVITEEEAEFPKEKFNVSWTSKWVNHNAQHKMVKKTMEASTTLKKERDQVDQFKCLLEDKIKKVNQLIENFNVVSLQCHAKLHHDKKKNVDRIESVSKSKVIAEEEAGFPKEKKFKVSWMSKWVNHNTQHKMATSNLDAYTVLKKERDQVDDFKCLLENKARNVNSLIENFNQLVKGKVNSSC